jgi:uncharacterized protein YndB with AHSA1/START domain
MEPHDAPGEPIAKDIYIAAPPQIVYTYLTEPAKMAQWIGIDPQLDPRPGGIFRVSPNRVDVIRGTYLEAVPHSKVTFTWGFEGVGHAVPAGSTVVEITLQPEGDGTRLHLMHRNLSAEQRELHDSGWSHYVARLKIAAEGGIPEPDPLADPSIHHSWRERALGARSPEDQQ